MSDYLRSFMSSYVENIRHRWICLSITKTILLTMARYRIVCTIQEPLDKPHDAAHIVSVGVGDNPEKADESMTLKQVLDAMASGDSFYTKSPSTHKEASITKYSCSMCNRTTIRSSPDAVKDNNLDNLRTCRPFN